ncbi:MAG: GNAT family N-acetyltransferase, partial [Microlunatus sp.]|nr:GNAT family N-acetyltransferase [Microlunatus sp.]
MSPETRVLPFEPEHVPGIAAVCGELGWPSYADPAVAARGCPAPGVSTFVAVADGTVVGFAQVLSDGVVQAYLTLLGVLPPWRRQGIASRLVIAAFEA